MTDRNLDALTMRVLSLEEWRKRVERPTIPSCPWWCTVIGDDHRADYDSHKVDDPTVLHRIHACAIGGVSVQQPEWNTAGKVERGEVEIAIYDEAADPLRARQIARDLEAAAVQLERIQSGQ